MLGGEKKCLEGIKKFSSRIENSTSKAVAVSYIVSRLTSNRAYICTQVNCTMLLIVPPMFFFPTLHCFTINTNTHNCASIWFPTIVVCMFSLDVEILPASQNVLMLFSLENYVYFFLCSSSGAQYTLSSIWSIQCCILYWCWDSYITSPRKKDEWIHLFFVDVIF